MNENSIWAVVAGAPFIVVASIPVDIVFHIAGVYPPMGQMKTYVVTTGAIFGLLALAHLWRMIEEGPRLAREPWFVAFTLIAAAMCFSAWRVLKRIPRS